MNDYKKKLEESRYLLTGNGWVVDDDDATEACRLAFNRGLDQAYLTLAMDLDKEFIKGSLMSNISKILNKLKQ